MAQVFCVAFLVVFAQKEQQESTVGIGSTSESTAMVGALSPPPSQQ